MNRLNFNGGVPLNTPRMNNEQLIQFVLRAAEITGKEVGIPAQATYELPQIIICAYYPGGGPSPVFTSDSETVFPGVLMCQTGAQLIATRFEAMQQAMRKALQPKKPDDPT